MADLWFICLRVPNKTTRQHVSKSDLRLIISQDDLCSETEMLFWRKIVETGLYVAWCCRDENSRIVRNYSSQENENKEHRHCDYCASISKTSILWGTSSIPKNKLQEASGERWREKSASGDSGPFCSGYIPLLPAHPFNTWLAFSELSALLTCRQAGLI